MKRLCEVHFPGDVFIVDLQATCGVKDPSDLHVQDPGAFIARGRRAIERATPVLVAWPGRIAPRASSTCASRSRRRLRQPRRAAERSHETSASLAFSVHYGHRAGRDKLRYYRSNTPAPAYYPSLLGPTAYGRKGTAMDHVKRVMRIVDEEFVEKHFASGIISGEGLYERFSGKSEHSLGDDKRLVLTEPEFAKVLANCDREGNSLSANVREIYHSGSFEIMRSKNALKVRDAHAALIGHCTTAEYVDLLKSVSMANGFANRFLLAHVERENILPFGGTGLSDADYVSISEKVKDAIKSARPKSAISWKDHRPIPLSDDARALYAQFYYLRAQEALNSGLIGAMLARLETNVLRVALIFALLQCATEIGVEHLRAAIAAGAYARSSTLHAFGPTLGSKAGQEILDALRDRDDKWMSRTEIRRQVFQDHRPAKTIKEALDLLIMQRLVMATSEQTSGAPRGSFRAIGPGDQRSDPYVSDPLITLITQIS